MLYVGLGFLFLKRKLESFFFFPEISWRVNVDDIEIVLGNSVSYCSWRLQFAVDSWHIEAAKQTASNANEGG